MSNQFDDENGIFRVLVNDEGQYSLWPDPADVPRGWTTAHGPTGRSECLQYVDENWKDMRPRSLARLMDGSLRTGTTSAPGGPSGPDRPYTGTTVCRTDQHVMRHGGGPEQW